MIMTFRQCHHHQREELRHSLWAISHPMLKNLICNYHQFYLLSLSLWKDFHDLIKILWSIYSEKFFETAGRVVDVILVTSKKDGSFMNYGYAEFSSSEEAQKVRIVLFFLFVKIITSLIESMHDHRQI